MQSRQYDPANAPAGAKKGATIGVAVTEQQRGSDVCANTTRAVESGGRLHENTGHKVLVCAYVLRPPRRA